MINDQVTTALIIGIIPALVFLLIVYFVNKSAARAEIAAISDTAPIVLPVMPLFTMTMDTVVTFEGKRYRIYFAVEDVQMIEDE